MMYRGYIGSTNYNEKIDMFHGRILGLLDIISYEGETFDEMRNNFHKAVDKMLEEK